jgi:Carbohydrate esterase, sialic acid-specific acetylesterase
MTEPAHAASIVATLPTRIISYAWGESYVNELLTFAIPALLAPGNLPYVVSQVDCEVVLATEQRFFAKVAANPAIAKVQKLCPVRFVGLDDLVTNKDKYGMALTYALHRAFADLGSAMTDCWLMFLNADFVLADGSLKNLLGHLMQGERIVASPSYCSIKEDVIPELRQWFGSDPTVLAIPPREMSRLILRHRHSTIRGKTVNQDVFHMRYMDQFYWLVDDNTLLGHQMPVAIVGMRPERHVPEPNSLWDHGLMVEFCPAAEVKLLGDSDEFLMLELRGGDIAQDQIGTGPPDPREVGERMISWVTPYQASFALRPLTLHAAELPPSIDEARQKLDDFTSEVMSYAPKNFPSHLDHPQWTYHWPAFMKARHAFLSTRFGACTETEPPPRSMSEVDQCWWRLDGVEKALARKKRVLAVEDREFLVELLTSAMEQIDRDLGRLGEVDRQSLIDEVAATRPPNHDTHIDPYSGVTLGQRVDSGSSRKRTIEWDETNRKKALMRQAIASVEQHYLDHVCALEVEHDRVRSEYNALIRPRVKTAGIPVVRRRLGPVPQPAAAGRLLGRIVQPYYYKMFGRWPRVTMLNPFWAPLQPLLRVIDKAKADGAEDVLFVGDRSGIAHRITDLPGAYAWVSVAGVTSGLLHKALDARPHFDLCVVDLEAEELPQFPEIVATVKPFMRPEGIIVGFHLNFGQPLTADPQFQGVDGEVVFTGTEQSLRATTAHTAALARGGRSRLAIKLALNTPRAWLANRAERARPPVHKKSPPPQYLTGITMTTPAIPWFEGDNDTVEFAVATGVLLGAAEAPVSPENRVAASVANPPGTVVILSFGQSNAANDGAARYVSRQAVHVFNLFDMNYYKAVDPLPGATNSGGSVWGRLGDKMIESGQFRSVLFVPIAVGASYIQDWTPPDGYCYRRLQFALTRLKRVGIRIDMLCWHQGEADANHRTTSAEEYKSGFRRLVKRIRAAGCEAPIYVAIASLCENDPHPHQNREQIRLAQQQLVAISEGLLPGPDTDRFDDDYRSDGCHFSESGLDAVAQAWLESIAAHPPACSAVTSVTGAQCGPR